MKIWRIILLLLLTVGLASCGSGKRNARVAYSDDIYADKQISDNNKKNNKKKGSTPVDLLLAEAYSWEGTPYRAGGHSRSGTDCSGYIMEVFRAALGVELPRNSEKQSKACEKVKKNKIQPGDLLFFHPNKKGKVSHVGLYVGDNKMLHASGSKGVMESDITLPYWQKCFNHAGRVPIKHLTLNKEKTVDGTDASRWNF